MQSHDIIVLKEMTAEQTEKLLSVWESSVHATHHFLTSEDIAQLKLEVKELLPQMEMVLAAQSGDAYTGFIAANEDKIEMLFVADDCRGKGIGRALVEHAMHMRDITFVDVNEQNRHALGFYARMGFQVFGRDQEDRSGQPFPILHLKRAETDDANI